jgi:hypothetical protein
VLAGVREDLPIVVPRQVHGIDIADAVPGDAPRADGVVAGRPGFLVGVVTADCVPVLLVDRQRRVAAAVHAGWRGAAAGVVEAAVARLGIPPTDVEAAVGPAIGGCCYEVGAEVAQAFRARTGEITAKAWTEANGRPHVDLRAAIRLLLHAARVRNVALLGPCTACDRRYHSYRRDGAGTGRQLSFVGWA